MEYTVKNGTFLIDEEDLDIVSRYYWRISHAHGGKWYVLRQTGHKHQKLILLHRFLLNAPKNKEVDHINGNTLDNRKCNLRLCEHAENMRNRKMNKNNKTGYKGVSLRKDKNLYTAEIQIDYKTVHLGFFKSSKEAALAYNKKAIELYGEFAQLNQVD